VLELIDKDEEWLISQVQKEGFETIGAVYLGEYISSLLHLYGYTQPSATQDKQAKKIKILSSIKSNHKKFGKIESV